MARLIAVCDTGPILAAVNKRDRAHRLASALIDELGRDLLVPMTVVTEADYLIRDRVGVASSCLFLNALSEGSLTLGHVSATHFRRAAELDGRFADLNLGLVDASVMAIAEAEDLPILTFDFVDFCATHPRSGTWRLVVDEHEFAAAVAR